MRPFLWADAAGPLFDGQPAHEKTDHDDGENRRRQGNADGQCNYGTPRFAFVAVHEIEPAEKTDDHQPKQNQQNYFHHVAPAMEELIARGIVQVVRLTVYFVPSFRS